MANAGTVTTHSLQEGNMNDSSAISHSPTDEPSNSRKLQPTLDEIQKRFSCSPNELLTWRNALLYRYTAIEDKSVKIEVTDYDCNMQELQSHD